MARAIAEIESEVRRLARPEQERLLRALLEELDGPVDPDTERPGWRSATQKRRVRRRLRAVDSGGDRV